MRIILYYLIVTTSIVVAGITNNGATLTIDSSVTVTTTGSIENISGIISNSGNLVVTSDLLNNDSFTNNPYSTVKLNGGDQLFFGTDYYNLVITGLGVKTMLGNVIVQNDLTLNGADINLNGFDLTVIGDFHYSIGEIIGDGNFTLSSQFHISHDTLDFSTDKDTLELVIGSFSPNPIEWSITENIPWLELQNDRLLNFSDTLIAIVDREDLVYATAYQDYIYINSENENDTILVLIEKDSYNGPVWYVSTDGENDAENGFLDSSFSSIQFGINMANDGDTILVAPGTYVENINYNSKNLVIGSHYLTTGDTSYISQTTIYGDSSGYVPDPEFGDTGWGSVVIMEDGLDSTAKIIGFTITHGYGNWDRRGGGVSIINSSPILQSLIVKENRATNFGGGIYISNRLNWESPLGAASPKINNCLIINNNGSHAGGVGVLGFINANDNPTTFPEINNTIIMHNSGNQGAGIGINDGKCAINFTIISNNSSSSNGGGVHLEGSKSEIFVKKSSIVNNTAEVGGGIHNEHQSYSYIENSILYSNEPNQWKLSYFSRDGKRFKN